MKYYRPTILLTCTYVEILTLLSFWNTLVSGSSSEIAFGFTATCTQNFVSINLLYKTTTLKIKDSVIKELTVWYGMKYNNYVNIDKTLSKNIGYLQIICLRDNVYF